MLNLVKQFVLQIFFSLDLYLGKAFSFAFFLMHPPHPHSLSSFLPLIIFSNYLLTLHF